MFLYLLLASPILGLIGYFSRPRFSDSINGWGVALVGLLVPFAYLFYLLVVDVLQLNFLEINDKDLEILGDKRFQRSHIIITAKIMILLALFYLLIIFISRLRG